MATHSNVLAWRIPGTGEPGGLPSMGSHRVGHDRSDSAAVKSKMSLFFFNLQFFLLCSTLTAFILTAFLKEYNTHTHTNIHINV